MQPQKISNLSPLRMRESGLQLVDAAAPLDDLLASGGDGRLTLNARDGRNVYGCTPFPRPGMLDFASSTASSISPQAYRRAREAQARMWLRAALIGVPQAFDDCMQAARGALCRQLNISTEVVFSPSGTDAQLQALFLVKALLGTPLVTIIAGADQTGSGTTHTARGHHFSDCTSLGALVQKAAPVAGLNEQVETLGVPFCDQAGKLRSDDEMDAAVYGAVAKAIGAGKKVLLQAMDSSKLGWRGPSAACLATITAAWPGQVCIVVDACQMRLGRPQLNDYLDRGYFVLVTGSKFFTGPAFSGALLVPAARVAEIDRIDRVPQGLGHYTTRYDWPRRWHRIRQALPDKSKPNYGQWLRWEATSAQMEAYFTVPAAFRDGLLEAFAAQVPGLIHASNSLRLMTEHCGSIDPGRSDEMRHRTIFAFVPHEGEQALSPERCAMLYRALGRDLCNMLPPDAPARVRAVAARVCQIGQPVVLQHRPGAALRICASARMVSDCWSRDQAPSQVLAQLLEDVRAVIEKIDWLIVHPEYCAPDQQ